VKLHNSTEEFVGLDVNMNGQEEEVTGVMEKCILVICTRYLDQSTQFT